MLVYFLTLTLSRLYKDNHGVWNATLKDWEDDLFLPDSDGEPWHVMRRVHNGRSVVRDLVPFSASEVEESSGSTDRSDEETSTVENSDDFDVSDISLSSQ
jgi:hypothetical protein